MCPFAITATQEPPPPAPAVPVFFPCGAIPSPSLSRSI